MSRSARALRALVHAYQGLRAGRPSPCRFEPSCSAYTAEALARHGAIRGTGLGLRRLLRCRPGGGRGWDPVPDAGSVGSPVAHSGHPPAASAPRQAPDPRKVA